MSLVHHGLEYQVLTTLCIVVWIVVLDMGIAVCIFRLVIIGIDLSEKNHFWLLSVREKNPRKKSEKKFSPRKNKRKKNSDNFFFFSKKISFLGLNFFSDFFLRKLV